LAPGRNARFLDGEDEATQIRGRAKDVANLAGFPRFTVPVICSVIRRRVFQAKISPAAMRQTAQTKNR